MMEKILILSGFFLFSHEVVIGSFQKIIKLRISQISVMRNFSSNNSCDATCEKVWESLKSGGPVTLQDDFEENAYDYCLRDCHKYIKTSKDLFKALEGSKQRVQENRTKFLQELLSNSHNCTCLKKVVLEYQKSLRNQDS